MVARRELWVLLANLCQLIPRGGAPLWVHHPCLNVLVHADGVCAVVKLAILRGVGVDVVGEGELRLDDEEDKGQVVDSQTPARSWQRQHQLLDKLVPLVANEPR